MHFSVKIIMCYFISKQQFCKKLFFNILRFVYERIIACPPFLYKICFIPPGTVLDGENRPRWIHLGLRKTEKIRLQCQLDLLLERTRREKSPAGTNTSVFRTCRTFFSECTFNAVSRWHEDEFFRPGNTKSAGDINPGAENA